VTRTWRFVQKNSSWMLVVDDQCSPVVLNQLADRVLKLGQERIFLVAPNGVKLHPSVWHLIGDPSSD
jgi:hypothetical protein